MKLYYYQNTTGNNFGDDLNPWLWSRLLGELLDDDERELLVGIGTILDRRIPLEPRKVVFGSGIGYGRMPRLDETWRIYCVRGPLTATALGLPDNLAITDPALLVRDFISSLPGKMHQASMMPHHKTPTGISLSGTSLKAASDAIGINYIDPRDDIEDIISAIRDSEMLIAEAMHGAIVADALRVPWIPIQLSSQISNFKWWDWCRSLEMDYEPRVFEQDRNNAPEGQLTTFIHDLLADAPRQLSDPLVSASAATRLYERLHQLKADYEVEPRTSVERSGPNMTEAFTGSAPNIEVLRLDPRLYELHLVAEQIEAITSVNGPLIIVDQEWIRGDLSEDCRTIPFLERDGQYWGPPADDATAIREVERLRQAAAKHIVFAWPALWWLDHYADFRQYLESRYACTLRNERIVVFDLQSECIES
jgi:succinoglycan biosynthesis protein ExoV